MKHFKKGFTLVELIVVATILTILATVGFISYEKYLVDTRDSKRLAQLTGLRDGLRLGITKGKLPLPDDNVEIRNNSTPFLYQGYAGENVLESISYSEATKDPYDDSFYTYLVSNNRKDFQILGFLEEYNSNVISSTFPEAYAEDYSQRFPQVMGQKLGIVLEQDTNTPLQEIQEYKTSGYMDLNDTTTNNFDAYVTDTQIISGKENDLIGIIPFTTCRKIKENGDSYGDGFYSINPSGLNPVEVYCLMDGAGLNILGGWTLVARSVTGGVENAFGWLQKTGNIRDESIPYSMGIGVKDIKFSEMILATYTTEKNMESITRFDVNDEFLKYDWYAGRAGSCTLTYNISPITPFNDPCTVHFHNLGWYGHAAMPSNYYFYRYESTEGPVTPPFAYSDDPNIPRHGDKGLTSGGIEGNRGRTDENMGHFEGKQGMIFVR